MVAVITIAALVFYRLRKAISGLEIGSFWMLVRPPILGGLTILALMSLWRWLLYLIDLRRKLRARGISLREYSGWSVQVRSAWMKNGPERQ